MGGFVALAALMAGLLRDFKRDTRRQFDDLRAEFREAYAKTNKRIDDLRTEFREAYAQTNKRIDDLCVEFREAYAQTNGRIDDLRAEFREAHAQTNGRIDDLRTEFREAHAQTNRRIDDLRATVVAVIPRAAAEPVGAPPVRGDRAREATAAAGDPQQSVVESPVAPRAARRPPDKA